MLSLSTVSASRPIRPAPTVTAAAATDARATACYRYIDPLA